MAKKIPRQKMREQAPSERIKNFNEVPLGLTEEMAVLEAERCLQCEKPLCVLGCPVNIDIPGFIKLIKERKFRESIIYLKDYNILPAICGRVCPQETQCEAECVLGKRWEPVAIGYLERFIADWERENQLKECPDCEAPNNIKVAVVGSGPAGLTCAADLVKMGFDVTIFEALHTGGGVLVYGIPEFRLPKDIVADEIETLKMLGAKIKYNFIIGKILTIEDLREMGFKAFFIGVGAGLPIFLDIPGINLNNVVSANEFLTRTNLMKAYKFPEYDTPINIGKVVTVIGGGNVAMDSARVALRLGSEKVFMVYRRSEVEMPARREEYHHGKEEGIEFMFLTNPIGLIGDDAGNVKEMEVMKMELGKPDESGRRRPIPIKDSEFIIKTDLVVMAIGARANPILTKAIPELKLTGSATVISAMGAGRKAAKAIREYLRSKHN